MSREKTELEKCLDAIEVNLSKLQVSGLAAIPYSEALKLLYKAKELARLEVKKEDGDG